MSEESELDPTFIAVRCEECGAKLRVRSSLAGKIGACPKCHCALPIPMLPDYADEDYETPASAWERTNHGYRLSTTLEHEPDDNIPLPLPKELTAPVPEKGYLDQLGLVRQVAISKHPRWTFLSGVFEFPWYDEVWPRWIWLMLGGMAISVIPVLALGILDGAKGYSGVALAFFAMPQIWLTLWTGSHAACCGMQVFEDTAAGNDHINGWPDPNWREWMLPFLHQAYVVFMVFALAYGVGSAAGLTGYDFTAAIILAEFLLFPVCWLSVLEGNNVWQLISPNVVRTLITKLASWLMFYLLASVIAVIWIGTLWGVCKASLLLGMLANGVLFGTFVLIYFRLLGRLAWSISHQRKKKRKQATKTLG
ncbi:MAG: hypothetical protein JWM11_3684 [Planctomycetaceae bacterium]|nr:hypothetical protein [Planctomycetaceae bacterium]